ncbi:uncharacterized protein LOC125370068 [Ricinus communis]|uniref:uncharacterized protein LOC125370068 n=1 Tax=Ricinus communis TaxID=3988 RepID=UPI00201AA044|nr:uncharacterized protein LOC125370068 [Ricinus communis]
MEATQWPSLSPFLSGQPLSIEQSRRRTRVDMVVKARREGKGRDYWGSSVDEGMIVLRRRIREINMVEESCDHHEVSPGWMEWEKEYYVHYNQDVCEAMGLLQNYLMNVRPSLALGTLALVTFSVLISSGVVLFHALEIAKGIISGFHICN